MTEMLLVGMLVVVLIATAALYWLRMGEQTRDRRIQERLWQIRHVTAVLRASIAEGRRPA